jgi:signal transduction histidine kinase/ActR/RegA family two-component response regulator
MFYLEKRIFIVKRVILFIATMLFTFGAWGLQEHFNVLQAIVDLLSAGILLLAGGILHYRPKSYDFISKFILLVGLLFILITTLNNSELKSSILWPGSFVLLAFLLRSSREGWFWFIGTITSFVVLNHFHSLHYANVDVYIHFTIMVFIAILATWYEQVYEEKLKKSEELNKQLDEMIEERTEALSQAKEEAKEAQYRAEEASRAKSTFLASMSHEIRTPLNAINGFITLLKAEEEDFRKSKQLTIIQEASGILTDLISDILDLSKIESGQFEINMTDFKPNELFIQIIELYQAKAEEKNIKIELSFSSKLQESLTLYSDALRIRQVLNNLLSNAIKFTPENGSINVEITFTKHNLEIKVEDNGIGIDEKNLKRIFEPFQQSEADIESTYGGTGLGLAICKQIARHLGGELTVSSRLNYGSSFVFSTPIRVGRAVVEIPSQERLEIPAKINAHILIAEDVRANQMFLGMLLKRYAITFDMANDGKEAVTLTKTKKYDLILMDENMPKMDGIEAMKIISKQEKKSRKKHTQIIALTANALQGDRERLLAEGMDGYLSKPIDPDELIYQIARMLKQLVDTK